MLRNSSQYTRPLAAGHLKLFPKYSFQATRAPQRAVLTNKVPSQNVKCNREPLIYAYVQWQICWSCLYFCQFQSVPIARGAVYLRDVKEWKKCGSLGRAHSVSTRQNTFTASVIDCLCNNHTPPASFFRKKPSDWSRWEQIKTDCTEQPQSNGEFGILSKYKKPVCLVSELETELFHRSFEVLV